MTEQSKPDQETEAQTPAVVEGESAPESKPDQEASDRPDWLPEKFWNAEDKAPNVENLAKSYAEIERTRGKDLDNLKSEWETQRLAGRPEAPDKYKLPENDALDPEALAASPVVNMWRNAAHEAGLGQEQFEKVILDYATSELEQSNAARDAEMQKLGENAAARTEAVSAWANKTFEGEELQAVFRIATDAAGVKALEKLMGNTGASDGGDPGPTGDDTSEAEIRALMNTPAYYSPHKRDPAVVEKVQKFFAKTYGKK